MSLPLIALAIAAFGIGTTEFVILGLLTGVADDLGVSVPAAGYLVSGYAMGVVVGAPLLAVITSKWPRKPTLIMLMGIFIVGNVLCALAPDYLSLMAARVVTSFSHGAFFGIASVTAAGLVVPEKRGQAISLVFAGLTLASVLGVPLGSAIGQALGWRASFWSVAAIGVVAILALWQWLPLSLPRNEGGIMGEFRVLKEGSVLLALGLSVLASISMFTVVTYIEPMLSTLTGVGGLWITLIMAIYGLGLTAGSILGGRLGHRALMPVLMKLMLGTGVILVIMSFTLFSLVPAMLTIFLWAAISFAIMPLLQLLVVDQAAEAPNLASTLNQSAFNLGNATGASVGGVVISAGLPMHTIPLAGAIVIVANIGLTMLAWRVMQRRSARRQAEYDAAHAAATVS
ncbi:MFS transporter [Kushneria pakistanensis]|uniref:MFS transporter n=1 Tax=Kushneria pakistanensis TaxID=1508770 RepID=A0ABQ3FID2_9GAMM|nr:MFS transporter [Kushneria pakistanensis]GHC25020.1 MFS transporter [Kushneria pakistanensis]